MTRLGLLGRRAGWLAGIAAAAVASACAPAPRGTVVAGALSIESVVTPTPRPIPLPPMETKKLANGLEVILIENHRLPVVSFGLQLGTGSDVEPSDKAGLADLTMQVMRSGTTTRSAEQIAETIDFVGGALQASSGHDYLEIDSWMLRKDLDTGLALLADIVSHPDFPAKELERARLQALAEVKSRYDDPGELASVHAEYLLYGENDPYGSEPTTRSIESVTREDLVAFHRQWIVPTGTTLAIAGDVDGSIFPRVEAAFAAWTPAQAAPATTPALPAPAPLSDRAARPGLRIVDKPDLTQSFIALALPGPPRANKDYFALTALDAVVGDGFAARLTHVVRTQNGKTYDIEGSFHMRRRRGSYEVTTSTRTAETAATVALVVNELKALASGTRPVTEVELAQAKRSLIGSYPAMFETADGWADSILVARLFGLDLAEITDYRRRVGEVTVAQVNEAARRWLDPTHAAIVVVGNAAEVKDPLEAAYGKAEVVSFLTPTHAIDARAAAAPRSTDREKNR